MRKNRPRRRGLHLERLENRRLLTAAVGPEFPISSTTAGDQFLSAAAMNEAGAMVVVWDSVGQDGDGHGVFGQRFDGGGNKRGGEFPVNTTTAGDQLFASIALDGQGNSLVVWESQTPGGREILAQRFDKDGNAAGNEVQVNTTSNSDQLSPSVAMNRGGAAVVVWDSVGQRGAGAGILGQRFDADGQRAGGEFPVSTAGGGRFFPDVAMAGDGSFVAVWESDGADGDGLGIFGQRFDAGGGKAGGEFQVNSEPARNQTLPAIAINRLGQFVVVWDSEVPGGHDVLARRYRADGTPLGQAVRVNQQLAPAPTRAKVSVDERFNFAVVWDRQAADGDGKGVLARYFDRDGQPLGDELVVNTFTAGNQSFPVVAGSGTGQLVVVWESRNQDGGGLGVFAQRFIENRPIVDLNGPLAGIDYAEPVYIAGREAVRVVADNMTVTDVDSPTLASATATITNPMDGAAESLLVDTSGSRITAGYHSAKGVLTLTGSDTLDNYQSVLRTLSYHNGSATPNATERIIDVVAHDGAVPSERARSTVTVIPDSSPPGGNLVTPQPGSATNQDLGNVEIQWADVGPSGLDASTFDPADVTVSGVTVDRIEHLGDGLVRYWYSDDGDTLAPGTVDVFLVAGAVADNVGNRSAARSGSFVFDTFSPIGQLTAPTPVRSSDAKLNLLDGDDLGYVEIRWTDEGPAGMDWRWYDTGDVVIVDAAASQVVSVDRIENLGDGRLRYWYNDDGQTLPAGIIVIQRPAGQVADLAGNTNSQASSELFRLPAKCPWSNPLERRDVDIDGFVVPKDVLWVINELNRRTIIGPLGQLPALGQPAPVPPPFFDVDCDGYAAPRDALAIINYLNLGPSGEAEGPGPSEEMARGLRDQHNSQQRNIPVVASGTSSAPPALARRDDGEVVRQVQRRPALALPEPLAAPHNTETTRARDYLFGQLASPESPVGWRESNQSRMRARLKAAASSLRGADLFTTVAQWAQEKPDEDGRSTTCQQPKMAVNRLAPES